MSDAMTAPGCIDELKEVGMGYAQFRVLVGLVIRSLEPPPCKRSVEFGGPVTSEDRLNYVYPNDRTARHYEDIPYEL